MLSLSSTNMFKLYSEILKSLFLIFIVIIVIHVGCKRYDRDPHEVIVHELSDADMLNPFNYQGESSGFIMQMIFQSLINIDFISLELVPVLAESLPHVEVNDSNKLLITFRIKEEAVWDNGTPVTAQDVEFSLKVTKNPKVNNARMKPYYEFIEDLILYDKDPKKLTFVCKEKYIRSESQSGTLSVIPKYIYDPQGLMNEFTIRQLNENADTLANNSKIIEFADWFNSEKFQRDKNYVVGSGPYSLDEWITNDKLILKRKSNWWGDKFKGTNVYFDANPPKIVFQVINDQTLALVALKGEKVDAMRGVKPKDFLDLKNSEKFNENFTAATAKQLAYSYLGMNIKTEKFADKKVRKALAHLIDVNEIIDKVNYGMAIKIAGPIHPSLKREYNSDLHPYEYNPELAKQLLTEAGWKDSNGNGILDKDINGDLVEFNIEYLYNAGNDIRKSIGLIFQEKARKLGINVTVISQEWSVFLEKLKNHDFEMLCSGFSTVPLPTDHKQIFHTEAINGGNNLTGFGNAETDALIDSIRTELNADKRAVLSKKFQAILHEEVPMIFLYSPFEKLIIHKRFSNVHVSELRPGFWPPSFSYAN